MPDRLRVSAGQLERILDVLAEAVTVTERDGGLVFANAAALERMGLGSLEEAMAASPSELLARFEITTEDGRPLHAADLPGRRLLRGQRPAPLLLRLVDRDTGGLRWTLVKATEFEDDDGRRLAVNVLEDVTESKEQELRARFLLRVSETLSSSLDLEATLQRAARLAVPELADWCAIDLLEAGHIRQLAVAHVDPAKVEFVRQLRARHPARLEDPFGVALVLRSGRSMFYGVVPDELLAARVRDEPELQLVRQLQVRSLMIVPMRSRSRVLGAISLVTAESGHSFDSDDLAFAEDFAARAASATENARLYQERSDTARTLQRSLRPARLPALSGWRTAALYHAGEEGSQIGGDFYDLFGSEEAFTLIVGDVTGKGIRAATLTALARHSAGAAALLGLSPSGILRLLNRLLLEQADLSLVTAVVARITHDQDGASMTVASAGHPLPLRHRGEEPAIELGGPGVLLGFDPGGDWRETTVAIEPGDTLLFYTDGVTDALGPDGRFGEQRLHDLLPRCSGDPDRLLVELNEALRAFESGEPQDDTAMLAVQLTSLPGETRASDAGDVYAV
ncbi:MAG: SpoIIE family protein phosphatase [Solirubrobacteraceae bacterium]